ncbi:DUF4168 domain-containing protein [Sphingobium sp. TCM1]|uniref:DUF4168 domain-containing protein n=1 Tax=Sphingobium sp. TCM1 TaxID=453246 RepID=UPI0007F4462D|nr:DUF4168 domain-containing protein [Sphingobium sp. TCM1]OAN58612.1 hypothetical protein A7Q26_13255 [Sphingobium sp. TCM1]
MMFIKSIGPVAGFCALSLLAGTGAAQAQDAASPTVPPAMPSAPGQAGSFTDVELGQYVKAARAVQGIQQDTATPDVDKQARMAAAVQDAGLTPEKFNEISAASQSDPALQQRIQTVASKLQAGSTPQ